jgi:hypothetical protein
MICSMSKVNDRDPAGFVLCGRALRDSHGLAQLRKGAELARDILIEIEGEERAATELERRKLARPAMDHESLELALVKSHRGGEAPLLAGRDSA